MNFDKEYFEGNGSNYNSYEDKIMTMRNIYFPLIKEYVNPADNILDIGCAFGYFLKFCDDYHLKTFGIDVSKYAIDEATKVTKAKLFVHDVNTGMSFFENDYFDIITLFDVIEHLISPFKLLEECKRILKKDGNLVMTTPNLRAIEKIFYRNNWHGFRDKSHIYLFTPSSLRHLVNYTGFKIVAISTPFHPLPKIIQKIMNKTGLGGQIWLVAKKL